MDEQAFRVLSDAEYDALGTKEKLAYLRRAIEQTNWRVLVAQAELEREQRVAGTETDAA
jgi:hypothetical protein